MKHSISKLVIFILLCGPVFIHYTNAYFTDVKEVKGSTFSTAVWELASHSRDVVINEIMWMGSSAHENDEWIELKNNTDHRFDLDGWKIEGAGPDSHSIELKGVIEPEGYFIVAKYPTNHSENNWKAAINNKIDEDQVSEDIHLKDHGERLVLVNSDGRVIDETPDISNKEWVAGLAGSNGGNNPGWHSMERTNASKSGDREDNWHTCLAGICNEDKYWDEESEDNYGTPKDTNSESANEDVNEASIVAEAEVQVTPPEEPLNSPTPQPTIEPT